MDEDKFNLQIRKFLKKVGITSQREIERAVREAVEKGDIAGSESLAATMTLELPGVGLKLVIEDEIGLE